MSERSGVDNLIRALDVPAQARRGLAVGALVGLATYWLFVVSSGGSPYPTPYLLGLALVLTFAVGLFATLAFTVAAAYRVNRSLADAEDARDGEGASARDAEDSLDDTG